MVPPCRVCVCALQSSLEEQSNMDLLCPLLRRRATCVRARVRTCADTQMSGTGISDARYGRANQCKCERTSEARMRITVGS